MKTLLLSLSILLAAAVCYGQTDDLALMDTALAQVGMTRDDVRFDQDEMATWNGDRWRTRYFTMLHKNPYKLPKYGKLTLDELSGNAGNITALLTGAIKRLDHPIRRGLIGDQLAEYNTFPDSVPVPSITSARNALIGKEYAPLRDKIDIVFRIVDDKNHFFKRGLGDADKDKYRKELFNLFKGGDDEIENDDIVYEMLSKIDFDYLYAGAQDIAEAVRRLADSLEYLPFPKSITQINTRKGLIIVGTPGNDKYDYIDPPLMIIDGGGDDEYLLKGYPNHFPLSIIVDIAGNDRYISTDSTTPGIGGAILGMSVVIDKAGNDYYEGVNLAQGSGLFGVGILLDNNGDDTYVSRSLSQGSGVFGVGILSDSAGADSMYCVISSQGYGYTKGCGLLVNMEGNDHYVAEDDTLINPSSQTPEHNLSLAQGSAFGKRADFIDGHSWAGGVGILCDASGDDTYSAGLFAQGCAYWFSVGMLLDGGGNDTYNGIWYVQGAGAHFGVAYLDDFGGDDTYTATNNMAVGAGHDFTIGYFNERGGNDTYTVPNLSLGGGNANGIGIFHDHSGNDVYTTKGGTTLGRAHGITAGPRGYLQTIGIFVDGGGNDIYNTDWAKENSRWIGPKSDTANPNPYETGVGIDWSSPQ